LDFLHYKTQRALLCNFASEPLLLFELDLYTEFCCKAKTSDEEVYSYKIGSREGSPSWVR